MRWRRFHLANAPQAAGVYAIRQGQQWLYIGQSQNIRQRLASPKHPLQIAEGRPGLSLWWMPAGQQRFSLERQLIAQHEPEWNGSWQWGMTRWPSCYCPEGWGVTEADMLAALAAIGGA